MLNNILFNAQLIDYREKRKYHAWMEIQLLNGKITVHCYHGIGKNLNPQTSILIICQLAKSKRTIIKANKQCQQHPRW